jgi:hypothetical protein
MYASNLEDAMRIPLSLQCATPMPRPDHLSRVTEAVGCAPPQKAKPEASQPQRRLLSQLIHCWKHVRKAGELGQQQQFPFSVPNCG